MIEIFKIKGSKKMKKQLIIVASLVVVTVGTYVGLNLEEKQSTPTVQKYADARLSVLELQKGIEVKIAFLLEEVKVSNIKPTTKGLTQLARSIDTIRAYGKDISKEAKANLRVMLGQLRVDGFEDVGLLHKLETLATSSVVLPV